MESIKDKELELGKLYEFNKQLVLKEERISPEHITKLREELEDWFNWAIDGYAMLLCHDRRDYTVFHLYEKANPNPCYLAARELIEVLYERGDIISIDKTKDGAAWECWVAIKDDDGEEEAFCYYLFRYDEGVVEV